MLKHRESATEPKDTAYELKSITIGTKTLHSKKQPKKNIRREKQTQLWSKQWTEVIDNENPDVLFYIALDRASAVYNIIDRNDTLQPPGSHLSIPSSSIQWAVYSVWSARIALIPKDQSSYILVEMDDEETAQAFVREMKSKTGVELDLTSKQTVDKVFERKGPLEK